jgi:hypothetical protein
MSVHNLVMAYRVLALGRQGWDMVIVVGGARILEFSSLNSHICGGHSH